MQFAAIVPGRSCRRRGFVACRLHAVWRACAAGGEAPAHAVGSHRSWQELPAARLRRMPLACSVAGRRCRRLAQGGFRSGQRLCFGTSRVPSGKALAGDAGGDASSHAACMQCCGQVLPVPGLLFEPVVLYSDITKCIEL
jgi:hypothetical protein